MSRRLAGSICAGFGAILIASQTLLPQSGSARSLRPPASCLACGDLAGIDILSNVLLFVPLGIGLGLLGVSRWRGAATAAVTSGAIELIQAGFIRGRDGSVRDVVMNTAGGLAGIVLVHGWRHLALPRPAASRRLFFVGAASWLLVLAGQAALLERAFLPTNWYGQWAPRDVFPGFFSGRVRAVRLDEVDLPGTRLPDAERVRAHLESDRWTLTVDVEAGEPTREIASVFSIFDGERREMLLLGQKGTDMIVRYRANASSVGLRSPSISLSGVFAVPRGAATGISVAFDRGTLALSAASAGRRESRVVRLAPPLGVFAFLPFDVPVGPWAPLWTGIAIAGFVFPLGHWWGRGFATRSALVGLLLVAASLEVVPWLLGRPPAALSDWMLGTAAFLAGSWLGARRSGSDRDDSPVIAV